MADIKIGDYYIYSKLYSGKHWVWKRIPLHKRFKGQNQDGLYEGIPVVDYINRRKELNGDETWRIYREDAYPLNLKNIMKYEFEKSEYSFIKEFLQNEARRLP